MADESVADESMDEEPVVVEEPVAEESVADESMVEESVSEELVAEEPVAEEPRVFLKEEIDAMYPNRKVSFYATWGSKPVPEMGDQITIHAELSGYEGLEYIIRWQVKYTADDQEEWQDMGITGDTCTLVLTEQNLDWLFRVAVDIIDVEDIIDIE